MAGRGFKQGKYTPRNPNKYVGNANNIVCRSSWEFKFCEFLDNNPNILEWASEEVAIPYIKPTDGRVHRYFPDYWIKYQNKHGQIKSDLVEVKPEAQTKQPTSRGKGKKQQLYENITYAINLAKWRSAQEFCKKYGMTFRLVTENDLFKR